jgi:hypothetical protein
MSALPLRIASVAACWLALAPLSPAYAGAKSPGAKSLEKKWGIQPVSVRLAASGYMVYFRYRVVNTDLAKPLFRDGMKPLVVDRTSGQKLAMPSDTKLGGLRSSPRTAPANGKEYYVLFSNPAKVVKQGSHIDVELGDCKVTDLAVK